MRVLINVPDLKRPGGVSSLYKILQIENFFLEVNLFIIKSSFPSFIGIFLKYFQFILTILKYDVIHLNPSLNRKAVIRDAIFASIVLLSFKKLVIYWHGWDDNFEKKLKKSFFLTKLFDLTFNKAHLSIVLGEVFKSKLYNLGCKNRIVVETNAAESKYIESIRIKEIERDQVINLLFIARLEKAKGIYIAIETLELLNKKDRKFHLTIAGTGSEDNEIIKIAEQNDRINFVGYVEEQEKHEVLKNADIMFFPTFYPEGMPLTLLEGIMYGLPIITRPEGGITDIVTHRENGYLTSSKNAEDFKDIILKLTQDNSNFKRISSNNFKKSRLFQPEVVCNRLFSYYKLL